MDNPLDKTTLTTISLLESRLLRIEHLLHGSSSSYIPPPLQGESALKRLSSLERRFARMLSDMRVYGELIKIYKSSPDLFHSPRATDPPSQLPPQTIRSIILSSAPSYPATLSALTAINDIPIPDPSTSTNLISLSKRIHALATTQTAQAAEMAHLRRKSELLVRSWYETGMLQTSGGLADAEGRLARVEREVRRRERLLEEEKRL